MNAGKGKGPIKGYNYKNWNSNFDEINWGHPARFKCPHCGFVLTPNDLICPKCNPVVPPKNNPDV